MVYLSMGWNLVNSLRSLSSREYSSSALTPAVFERSSLSPSLLRDGGASGTLTCDCCTEGGSSSSGGSSGGAVAASKGERSKVDASAEGELQNRVGRNEGDPWSSFAGTTVRFLLGLLALLGNNDGDRSDIVSFYSSLQ